MIKISDKNSLNISEYIERVDKILAVARALEFQFTDKDLMNEKIEDCIMQIKLNLKIIREELYAIDDLDSLEISNLEG